MSDEPSSILACVDAEIDSNIFNADQLKKGYRYEHKRSFLAINKVPPDRFDGFRLLSAMYERIEKNLMRRPDRKVSEENWNLTHKARRAANTENISKKKNKSDEVTLERAIINKWPKEWAYQMPVASGLFSSTSDKRRAIDLVRNKERGQFDFIELKIASDTPLYAAMEILGYGLVYLASRQDNAKNLQYDTDNLDVLKANKITLCVLAPAEYYEGCCLMWLEAAINKGLENLVKDDLKMDFRFQQFHFPWNHEMSASNLPDKLALEYVYK